MTQTRAYWDKVGSEWDLIGSPLRPCPEDIGIVEQLVAKWAQVSTVVAPQAVILGVTQEIISMRWPERTHILACDREPAMIRSLWPHHRLSHAAALCTSWLSMPLVDGYADVVVADGSFSLLAYSGEYKELLHEMSRILAPGGILVVRLYIAPDKPESVDAVFRDLRAGAIGNFNTFKWRLAMALLDYSDASVCVNDVWEAWDAHVESAEQLAETLGWPLAVIRMIERYRGCGTTRYSFPSLVQVRDVCAPLFELQEVIIPSYQDGERYPTVCFRKS